MPNFNDGISRTSTTTTIPWDGTFEFVPGVCPQDWTAYDIGASTTSVADVGGQSELRGDTTAWCCPRRVYTPIPDRQYAAVTSLLAN